jgi:hypothetical protein
VVPFRLVLGQVVAEAIQPLLPRGPLVGNPLLDLPQRARFDPARADTAGLFRSDQ